MATYEDVIKLLGDTKRVVVAGPARSGTTIASRMIAVDLGLSWFKEETLSGKIKLLRQILQAKEFSVQAPGFTHLLHMECKDVSVVLMLRDCEDIRRSIQNKLVPRVGDKVVRDRNEKKRRIYIEMAEKERVDLGETDGVPLCEIIYRFWYKHQKALLPQAVELDYESLSSHSLWVPAEVRSNFHPRQIHL